MPLIDGASRRTKRPRPRRSRPGAAALCGYTWRLFPTSTVLVLGAVGCAWAVASKLDAPIEGTTLAVLASLALSVVFVDAAAPLTAASVRPLYMRRAMPALLGLGQATVGWLAARSLAATLVDAPWPGRWALLEWLTIALSQLAIGAVISRRRAEAVSFGPGLVVALLWYVGVAAPRLHQQLFDPADHPWRWTGLIIAAVVVALTASLDPSSRRPAGMTP